ncbi:MAG: tRNA (adenosine(37)-N6)-threonylcarbamoyltransferase complex dimerization subunit type 1 TsaB [Phycisphaeraceae bacterium]
MAGASYNLAMETSTRCGSIAVGWGDELLAYESLPPQQRHTVELLPRMDALARRFGFTPRDLAEVYVSIGPGSFTGLRIAVTMAKMFARVTGCKLVAVPTLDVVVRNASPAMRVFELGRDEFPPEPPRYVAVMLNAKRGQCFTGLYQRDGETWRTELEPALLTPAQVCERTERPLTVIGDHLPEYDWPADVTLLTGDRATPRAETLWRLARAAAKAGRYVDPYALTPLYVRLPEAEELWRNRGSEAAANK